nr:MAG TPA: hypothetical protein [Caudoviricetes sp.]
MKEYMDIENCNHIVPERIYCFILPIYYTFVG